MSSAAREPGVFLRPLVLAVAGVWMLGAEAQTPRGSDAEAALGREVATNGWILAAARTEHGDYDLFVSRPDGAGRRNLTRTPEWSEYGGRYAPDAKRMLYRRMAKGPSVRPGEGLNHDSWGATGVLVVANADGSDPVVQGTEGGLPWASWGPDGKQWACLYRREGKIRIHDASTRAVVEEMPRQGIFQQLFWSRDGKRLCGTANVNGQDWNILGIELGTRKATSLSRGLSCTPDWFQKDPEWVVYSNRTPGLGTGYGWTTLMEARASGRERRLLYGERGRHIYYGCTSPDDRYVLFACPEGDGGTDAAMAIIRRSDAPLVVPEDYHELRALHPDAKSGPVWRLPHPGFEPDWTSADVGGP